MGQSESRWQIQTLISFRLAGSHGRRFPLVITDSGLKVANLKGNRRY
jgi:hypothetical protein